MYVGLVLYLAGKLLCSSKKNRIEFSLPIESWIKLALAYDKIELIPLYPEISVYSSKLGNSFHSDPADRIIVSTAMFTNSPLITKDEKIRNLNIIKTIW